MDLLWVFRLIEEGVPTDVIVQRVQHAAGEDADFLDRFVEYLKVYRDNMRDGAEIPENVVDEDGEYAVMRQQGQEILPALDALILALGFLEASPN